MCARGMQMMALLDLAILDYTTISFRPSHLASAALVFVVNPPHHVLKQVHPLCLPVCLICSLTSWLS